MDDNSISKELANISQIIDSARLLELVRKEVGTAMQGKQAMVIGGELSDKPNYDVVVIHHSGKDGNGVITRRLRDAVEDIEITNLDNMVDNMLGIRYKQEKTPDVSKTNSAG